MPPDVPVHRPLSWWRQALRLSIGVVLSLAITLALGLWWDRRTGWAPWGTLAGMTAGMIVAVCFVIFTVFRRYRAIAPSFDDSADKETS